jgi:hypothetical protein
VSRKQDCKSLLVAGQSEPVQDSEEDMTRQHSEQEDDGAPALKRHKPEPSPSKTPSETGRLEELIQMNATVRSITACITIGDIAT